YRGVEQAGMEGTDIEPAGRGAFRKQPHHFTQPEAAFHLLGHRADSVAVAALDEYRARARHQPADDRPAPDFALGHESGRADAVEHEDIHPGHMVDDPQHGPAP